MAANFSKRGGHPVPGATSASNGSVFIKGQAGQIHNAMMKTQDLRGSSRTGLTQMAAASVVRTAPKVYSPLYEMSNLMLPRDLRTMNTWNRHFFNTNPVVRNAINLHATYPISKFNITCRDPKVKNFFIDQCDHIDLIGVLLSVSLEFWKLGEAFPYAELDENKGWWDYIFCFKKGSPVITASGEEKKIEDVQIGDRFVTHLGRIREVSKTFIREVDEEIVAIYAKNNIPVEVTKEHKVRFVKKKDIADYLEDSILEVPERTAQELQKGDYVIYPKVDEVKDKDEFSKEFCKLCGYFLAEGGIGYKKESKEPYYVEISFHKDDQESITEVCELIEKLYGSYEKKTYKSETIAKQYVRQNNPDLVSVTINLKEVAEQFAKMFGKLGGTLSHQKSMPEEFLYLPLEKQWELLVGYFNGDGGVNKNGDGFITTVSPHLAAQIHWLLARNGIFASRYTYPPSESGNYEAHRLGLTINDTHKLKPYVTTVKRKYMKIARTNIPVLENDSFYFVPVRKIELVQYKGTVHNITVDEDHTLLTRTFAISQCHNPDYIRVKTNTLTREPIITLIPDDALRRLAMTQNAADRALRQQLPDEVIYHLQRNEDIPLPNFNVSHLKMLSSDYDIRGSSIIMSVYKDLMLYDKIREAKYAQADNFINPVTLVKLGDPTGAWKPNDQDIINFRNAWMESQYDPDAKLITHGAVTVEKVSNAGQTLDVAQDIELIMKNLYAGLQVPEAIINGEGPNYSTASIGLEVLRARYERFRNLITRWVKKKLFEPISKVQDFYEWKDGQKKLIVPDVQWNKINLREVDSYITALSQMMSDEVGKSRVSKRTVFSFLDIDLDTENQHLKEEAIEQLKQQKELERLSKMSVEELSTLDSSRPIEDLHPGEAAGETGGGEGGEGGGGGIGGGAEPGLGAGLPDLGDLNLGEAEEPKGGAGGGGEKGGGEKPKPPAGVEK